MLVVHVAHNDLAIYSSRPLCFASRNHANRKVVCTSHVLTCFKLAPCRSQLCILLFPSCLFLAGLCYLFRLWACEKGLPA